MNCARMFRHTTWSKTGLRALLPHLTFYDLSDLTLFFNLGLWLHYGVLLHVTVPTPNICTVKLRSGARIIQYNVYKRLVLG